MTCACGVGLLMEYLDGALAPDAAAALEAHLDACARCAAFLASYRETPCILRDATGAAPDACVRAALRAALRLVRTDRRRRGRSRPSAHDGGR
jgi:anti-sigma factor RsiW